MNATFRPSFSDEIPDHSMKGPLIASGLFHVGLFLLTVVGLPFIVKDQTIVSSPISVEIVEIDKITQTNKPPAPKPKAD